MASLRLNNISKHFGKTKALVNIDLKVEDGEFCVLLGPSGCGKSTLLNIIAGLVSQDGGTVLMNDEPIDHLSPRQRDVAMVFQNYALYPHMSVAENLGFGLRMRKINKKVIKKQVTETAKLLGIENLLDRKPRELSGGQQQRVAMGRALVRRPKFFLLDEPLSNLDARLRTSVRLELKQLHRQIKGTTVYVTHDQVEAMTLGDKVVVMRSGKIHQMGSPSEIYATPADTFVATFIGSPEMNLFSGTITGERDRLLFSGDDFSLQLPVTGITIKNGHAQLGIRPEDFRIGGLQEVVFKVQVEMLSNIGSEKYVHGHLGRKNLTLKADKNADFQSGQVIVVSVDPAHIHLFQDGRRV